MIAKIRCVLITFWVSSRTSPLHLIPPSTSCCTVCSPRGSGGVCCICAAGPTRWSPRNLSTLRHPRHHPTLILQSRDQDRGLPGTIQHWYYRFGIKTTASHAPSNTDTTEYGSRPRPPRDHPTPILQSWDQHRGLLRTTQHWYNRVGIKTAVSPGPSNTGILQSMGTKPRSPRDHPTLILQNKDKNRGLPGTIQHWYYRVGIKTAVS